MIFKGTGSPTKTMPFGDKEIGLIETSPGQYAISVVSGGSYDINKYVTIDGNKFFLFASDIPEVYLLALYDVTGEDLGDSTNGWMYNGTIVGCTENGSISVAQNVATIERYDVIRLGDRLINVGYDGTYWNLVSGI